jgi:ArsR family transcriptional regulator, arsenate/arsenite/antimonite-responsive transcriptional repressor
VRDAAQFFQVLADEARLKMLWLLFNHQELCVCDLMAALEITQSKASRHLATLRHAGLVTDRKDGLWTYYALRHSEDQSVRQMLIVLRRTLAKRADSALLLARLHEWLHAENHGSVCRKTSADAATTMRRTAARARASLVERTRTR